MTASTMTIRVGFRRQGRRTEATATALVDDREVTGRGHAQRHPGDAPQRCIGEELALARALADLSSELRALAGQTIGEHEGHEVLIPA